MYSANLKLDLRDEQKLSQEEELPIFKSLEQKFERLLGIQKDIQSYNESEIHDALTLSNLNSGPVHINIPFDEPLYERLDDLTIHPKPFEIQNRVEKIDNFEIKSCIDVWQSAKRKMILVGVLQPNSIEEKWGAKRISDNAEANGCLGGVGLVERFNPAIRQLKERLEAGVIGNVLQIATRRQGSFPDRVGDVGVTKDLGSHDIDLAMWISGARYSRVFAQSTHKSGRVHEDMVAVSGALESGTIVNHIVNWMSPMKERLVVATGEAGVFFADTVSGDLVLHENGAFAVEWDSFESFRGVTEGNMTRFAYPKKEPLRAELEGFRDAVLGDGSDFVSLAEGLEVAKVADAILRSAASNTVQSPRGSD